MSAKGSGDRDKILAAGLAAVGERPWAGVGLGRFRIAAFASEDTPQHVLDNTGKAHNQFLSMAAEVGIPGGLLFVALAVVVAAREWWGMTGPVGTVVHAVVAGTFGRVGAALPLVLLAIGIHLLRAPKEESASSRILVGTTALAFSACGLAHVAADRALTEDAVAGGAHVAAAVGAGEEEIEGALAGVAVDDRPWAHAGAGARPDRSGRGDLDQLAGLAAERPVTSAGGRGRARCRK